jgi:hypothetical protein
LVRLRLFVQGNGGMARKATTTQNLDSDVAKELEEALDFDLTGGIEGDLDIAASMEDLEAQISQAADELARESRNGNTPVAEEPKAEKTQPKK